MNDVRVVPVHAYGLAGTLRPRDFVDGAGADGAAAKVTKTFALMRHEGDRFTVAFDFGAIVFFDVDEAQRRACLARVLAGAPAEPHPPLLDDYLVEVRADAGEQVSFDRAIVPVLDDSVVEILALVLAQSVAMDYYDRDVEALYQRVDRLCVQLADKGRLRGRARELNRFVGSILVTRNQIAMTLSLLDAPLATWEREQYDRLYRAVRTTFEIDDRYRTLQHKLGLIQDDLEILVDLMQHRRAALLEVVVVILIAVELLVGFLRR